jgi:cellulose synthase/poly-beta-1,6-N-acetylglucosamine synthase-like glycosyltransferase
LKIDVVVCAKNRAIFLERVLKQIIWYIPFENLIVIYGTSKDNTKEIAEKYATLALWDEDRGLGAARALGVQTATSEIVAMIDSDVILTKEWFWQLVKHFNDPKVAAVNGTCIFGYGCKPLEQLWEYIRRTATVNIGCHNTMFRRKAVLEVGNFNESIKGAGEDYELYYRLLKAGYKWVWVKDATVYHPMNMLQFLKHVRWWTQGRMDIDGVISQLSNTSLSRIYCRLVYNVLSSLWSGIKLSILVHPTFLFYSPLMNIVIFQENLRALYKNARFSPVRMKRTKYLEE